jgi:IclR family acetate operon transcriptional repressor
VALTDEPGDGPRQEPRGDMVAKALRLLVILGDAPQGMALSALARQAGYPPSTAHRLLSSLGREGFVVTDGERRWVLGLRVFELGQRVSHARGFTGIALPVMQRVTDATGEPTLMAVLEDDEQLYVHFVEGRGQVQITGEPGRRGPLHCTSMGKVLVAFASPDERRRLVESVALPALGPNAITDREAFRAEIERVRTRGWASADEEHEAGMLAVGVPILGPDGIAFAALSTAAPAYRSSIADLQGFLPALHEAATELAAVLPRRRSAV